MQQKQKHLDFTSRINAELIENGLFSGAVLLGHKGQCLHSAGIFSDNSNDNNHHITSKQNSTNWKQFIGLFAVFDSEIESTDPLENHKATSSTSFHSPKSTEALIVASSSRRQQQKARTQTIPAITNGEEDEHGGGAVDDERNDVSMNNIDDDYDSDSDSSYEPPEQEDMDSEAERRSTISMQTASTVNTAIASTTVPATNVPTITALVQQQQQQQQQQRQLPAFYTNGFHLLNEHFVVLSKSMTRIVCHSAMKRSTLVIENLPFGMTLVCISTTTTTTTATTAAAAAAAAAQRPEGNNTAVPQATTTTTTRPVVKRKLHHRLHVALAQLDRLCNSLRNSQ